MSGKPTHRGFEDISEHSEQSDNFENAPAANNRRESKFDIPTIEEDTSMPKERKKRESKISIGDVNNVRKRRESISANIKFRIVNPVRRLSKSVQDTLHSYASKRRGKILR